ncbi:MAG: hypothetical protein QCI00_04935, partial [Candidatus Thermoplasmatota archaeon]|nr:hypothetical protein [Candidatus Thermoplasmatota archaeon]
MKQNMRRKLTPLFITMMLLVSMFIILPTSVLAAPAIDDISKTDDLTCGEEIWVNASGLTEDERYYVRIWDGTEHVNLSDKKADEDGEISVSVNVPYTDTLGETYLTLWNVSDGELDNESIYITNTYYVRYKVGSEYVDHAVWNQSYEDATAFWIEVYNWTGSKYELFKETITISLFMPDGSTDSLVTPKTTNTGKWDIDYTFDYEDSDDNLETNYWVNVTLDGTHYSNATLPVKLDVTATLPTNVKWGDEVSISGYVKDGKGNGIGGYVVRLYSPVNGDYVDVDEATTFSSGRFSLSAPTDEDGASAGMW